MGSMGVIVVIHITPDQPPRVVHIQRRAWPNAFRLRRLMEPFQFPIRLRIVGRGAHVGHAAEADELLEVASYKLRPVVGDDPRLSFGIFFPRRLQNDFDIRFLHRLPQI